MRGPPTLLTGGDACDRNTLPDPLPTEPCRIPTEAPPNLAHPVSCANRTVPTTSDTRPLILLHSEEMETDQARQQRHDRIPDVVGEVSRLQLLHPGGQLGQTL